MENGVKDSVGVGGALTASFGLSLANLVIHAIILLLVSGGMILSMNACPLFIRPWA